MAQRTKPVFRSAKTGEFVSKKFVKSHKSTTVTEHVRKGRKTAG